MAEIKVSQLPEASEINDSDLLMIVQSGTNKKITKANARFASGDEISIGTTQPVEDEKLWIKSDETTDQARYKDGNTWKKLSIKALDSMEIGSVIAFAGDTIPNGWLVCDGSTITQSAYPELYDLIGGTLPDFRGRVLVGQDTNDTDFDTLGKTGGSKDLQAHIHTISGGEFATASDDLISAYGSPSASGFKLSSQNTTNTAGTGNSGNLQPYAVVKHIIKAKNTTPTMASLVNDYSESTTDGYSCDYINNANTYSTSEVKTDKVWIDGKPIYRKVITMQNQAVAQVSIGAISNIDSIVSLNGLLISSTLKNVMGSYNDDSNYTSRLYMYGNEIYYQQGSGWQSTSYDIQVIVEYTKTTD